MFLGIILFYAYVTSRGWIDINLVLPFMIAIGALALVRFAEGLLVIFARAKLSGHKMTKEPLKEIKKHFSEDKTFLGYGFRWEPRHKLRLQVLSKDKDHDWKLSPFWHRLMGTHKDILPENANGKSYLHGVSLWEETIKCPAQHFDKWLLITGDAQSGKGLTMQLLVNQAIARGDVVIYIDSNGRSHVEKSMRKAVKTANRGDMLQIYGENQDPTSEIRLDLFSNIVSGDIIAKSLAAVLENKIDEEFKGSVVDTIDAYIIAMIYLGEKPTVKNLLKAQSKGLGSYLLRMLTKAFQEDGSTGEYLKAKQTVGPKATELEVLVQWYGDFCRRKNIVFEDDIAIVVKNWKSLKDHQKNVSAYITNGLSNLTGDTVEDLISPIATDAEDFRPIWTMERIIDTKGVLYVNLAGMKSSATSGRLGALILADLVCAIHKRYLLKKKELQDFGLC